MVGAARAAARAAARDAAASAGTLTSAPTTSSSYRTAEVRSVTFPAAGQSTRISPSAAPRWPSAVPSASPPRRGGPRPRRGGGGDREGVWGGLGELAPRDDGEASPCRLVHGEHAPAAVDRDEPVGAP